MAQIRINRNYDSIEPPVAFGLKLRQLISVIAAAVLGFAVYYMTRKAIGSTGGLTLMMLCMMPVFFIGNYRKDGYYLEKYFITWFRFRFKRPGLRLYDSGNIYEQIRQNMYREEVLGVDEKYRKTAHSGRKKSGAGAKKKRSA